MGNYAKLLALTEHEQDQQVSENSPNVLVRYFLPNPILNGGNVFNGYWKYKILKR